MWSDIQISNLVRLRVVEGAEREGVPTDGQLLDGSVRGDVLHADDGVGVAPIGRHIQAGGEWSGELEVFGERQVVVLRGRVVYPVVAGARRLRRYPEGADVGRSSAHTADGIVDDR